MYGILIHHNSEIPVNQTDTASEAEIQEQVNRMIKNTRKTNKKKQAKQELVIQQLIQAANLKKALNTITTRKKSMKKGGIKVRKEITTNEYYDQLKKLDIRAKELKKMEAETWDIHPSRREEARKIRQKIKGLKVRLHNDYQDLERLRERAGIEEYC